MTARPTKRKTGQRRKAARTHAKSKATPARKQKNARKRPQNKARHATSRAGRRRISDPKSRIAHLRVASTSNGRAERAPLAKGTDVLSLLRRDHQNVRKLLRDLESAKAANRQSALLERIEEELKAHTEVEEEIFYPAFYDRARTKEQRQLYYEALEEHHAVDVILPEVKRAEPGSDQFAARVKVLKELVEHHADEEEKEMFPRARKIIGAAALRELGHEVAEKKKSSVSGGILKSFLGMR